MAKLYYRLITTRWAAGVILLIDRLVCDCPEGGSGGGTRTPVLCLNWLRGSPCCGGNPARCPLRKGLYVPRQNTNVRSVLFSLDAKYQQVRRSRVACRTLHFTPLRQISHLPDKQIQLASQPACVCFCC